ncbi:MAG TPA: alpha-amylase family glycosyl hydrolase [Dermatophilaceae bacterium]|nr:alpha-amylase family glycosyl hydrolase [Dermatophilaceae bacterium]
MTDLRRYEPKPYVQLQHPQWSKNATIYQINTRHFTPEGTFRAAEEHLPRIKELGAVIVWVMPVHVIGEENRKGELGSPYAVRDYFSVSPEFGDLDDLRHFVARAHELGLYVILDWVANHTAWDSNLVSDHPDWYVRDWKGDFRPTPWWDWDDIIDLNYDKPELREYMTRALRYWVEEADIDGYRCDVAGYVPLDFWENVRAELDAIKPVFMLAEWETRDLHAKAFDMTYAWSWNETMHEIAMGRRDAEALHVYYSWNERSWPHDSMRMTFVSNHDKNAWEGTEFEQFGDCLEAAIALSVVGEGMPLIYNGQEAGNERRLKFFERDPIQWREHPLGELYRKLFALKRENTALWNGRWGATMVEVVNDAPKQVLSFVRQNDVDKVFGVFNLDASSREVAFTHGLHHGTYADAITGAEVTLADGDTVHLPAWGYQVLVRRRG